MREILRLRTAYRLTLAPDGTARPDAYGFGVEDREGHEAEGEQCEALVRRLKFTIRLEITLKSCAPSRQGRATSLT